MNIKDNKAKSTAKIVMDSFHDSFLCWFCKIICDPILHKVLYALQSHYNIFLPIEQPNTFVTIWNTKARGTATEEN